MLQTLGTNQAIGAGSSVTFPYACKSVSKVFIKIDDASGDATSHTVTIQLGQRTICNGISGIGLDGFQKLIGGHENTGTEFQYQIDLGIHQLLNNENLYVTVSASSALDAVDVSALIDETGNGTEYPVRYTEYSDSVFTAENVLTALAYKNDASDIDEADDRCEVRDSVESSSPTFISANNWFSTMCQSNQVSAYGILKATRIPLTTTFNYSSSSVNRICVASLMGTNSSAVRQGQRQQAIAKAQVGK